MSLEEFTPVESSEWWAQSVEISEKFKESVKRAGSGIKRTQKDEKKAKKNDLLLAGFLVKIIIDKKFDYVLEPLFDALHNGFSSNLLLWILSLTHEEVSQKIREFSEKPYTKYSFQYQESFEFNDSTVDPEVKTRINYWVEDIVDILSYEYSSLKVVELQELFLKEYDSLVLFTKKVFIFFLHSSNIKITESQAKWITEFILSEVEKSIKTLKIDDV